MPTHAQRRGVVLIYSVALLVLGCEDRPAANTLQHDEYGTQSANQLALDHRTLSETQARASDTVKQAVELSLAAAEVRATAQAVEAAGEGVLGGLLQGSSDQRQAARASHYIEEVAVNEAFIDLSSLATEETMFYGSGFDDIVNEAILAMPEHGSQFGPGLEVDEFGPGSGGIRGIDGRGGYLSPGEGGRVEGRGGGLIHEGAEGSGSATERLDLDAAELDLSTTVLSGTLDDPSLARAARRRGRSMLLCYQRGLLALEQPVAGEVSLELTFEAGRVRDVGFVNDSAPDGTADCLIRAVQRLELPSGDGLAHLRAQFTHPMVR